MTQDKTRPEDQVASQIDVSVKDVFRRRFGEEGYTLIPHNNKLARWFFKRFARLFLLLITSILFVSAVIVLRVEEVKNVVKMLEMELRYPMRFHKWCYERYYERDSDGYGKYYRYYYIFPATDDSCLDLVDLEADSSNRFPISDPLYEMGWFSDKEVNALFMVLNLVYYVFPILGSLFISVLLFLNLIRDVPVTLLALANAGRLKPGIRFARGVGQTVPAPEHSTNVVSERWARLSRRFRIQPTSWQSYPDDLETALHSPWGIVSFAFWLAFYALAFVFARQIGAFQPEDFWYGLGYFLVLGIAPGFLAYVVGFGIWMLFVIASYIGWLTPVFELDIQPEHGDQCGGLKRLGDLCFKIAILIVIPATVFGLYVLSGHVEASLSAWPLIVVIALVTALIVAALSFFRPLFSVHRSMIDAKERFFDETMSNIAPVKARLRELVASGRLEEKETNDLKKQLEELKHLYPSDLKHPTWPFTTTIILAFYTSQVVPIISVVVGIIEFVRFLAE